MDEWTASTISGMERVPSQRKGQPVGNTPGNQNHALREPYPPQRFIVRPQARGQIDRNQEDDTRGKGERQEDGDQEVERGGAEREKIAEEQEHAAGDQEQRDHSKDI